MGRTREDTRGVIVNLAAARKKFSETAAMQTPEPAAPAPASYSAPTADSFFKLAQSQVEYGNYEDAAENYRLTLQTDPAYRQAMIGLAITHLEEGRFEQSIEYFEKSLAINPACAISLSGIGLVYMKMNDTDKARGYYLKCLEVNPLNTEALYGMATIYAEAGEYGAAIQAYRRFIKHASKSIYSEIAEDAIRSCQAALSSQSALRLAHS